jgi:hypothetical protein
MANTIRIKKRASTGAAGAPSSLAPSELAFNENTGDKKLYYGYGDNGDGTASSIIAIGGEGAFTTLDTAQTISGNKTFTGTVDLSGATLSGNTTFSNNLVVSGDLTVNGTTTTIDTETLDVKDKNITLGDVTTPSDATADGGGITLKGATDKTFNWIDATDSWTSSEHIDLDSGKEFKIAGTSVLSGSTLGSGVTGSSLTSVGTITSGTWNGTTIAVANGGTGQTTYTDGQLLIGNSATSGLTKATLTAGSNITITEGNGSITIAAAAGSPIAGDGIDVSGSTVSVDLKANGGLVIESTELAVDLGASSITGTLAIGDGGTGATTASAARTALGLAIGTNVQAFDADLTTLSGMQTGAATALAALTSTEIGILDGATVTTAELNILDGGTSATATTLAATDRMVINDAGSMVQVALSDLVTFLENGTVSGFELDGGTF